jgi:hypothetical protein
MTATTVPRTIRPPQPNSKKLSLADITGRGSGLPNRYVFHATEGNGKTSFAAQTPKPIFIQTRGETGLETLIDAGQLPEVPHFPEVQSWSEMLGAIDSLIHEDHEYKTLVIDTLNGAERLCHEHVCQRDFGSDWTERGFLGYGRGVELSLSDWRELLQRLDSLRLSKRMTIFCLCHTKVSTFKNPEGADYDRYSPDCNAKTWSLTHKWADAVLFGNFETVVDTGGVSKKGKARGGQQRMLYTERHASYDAKNRLGLPPEIALGNSPAEAWANFTAAVRAGREHVTNV